MNALENMEKVNSEVSAFVEEVTKAHSEKAEVLLSFYSCLFLGNPLHENQLQAEVYVWISFQLWGFLEMKIDVRTNFCLIHSLI